MVGGIGLTGIDQRIGIRLYLCPEIIVSSALDMVGGSQKEKCELKYVMHTSREMVGEFDNIH